MVTAPFTNAFCSRQCFILRYYYTVEIIIKKTCYVNQICSVIYLNTGIMFYILYTFLVSSTEVTVAFSGFNTLMVLGSIFKVHFGMCKRTQV